MRNATTIGCAVILILCVAWGLMFLGWYARAARDCEAVGGEIVKTLAGTYECVRVVDR